MLINKSGIQQRYQLWAFLFVEGLLLAGVSQLSGYALKRPGFVVNLEIITMLTPAGILHNLVLDPASDLSPFYFQIHSREGVWESPWLALSVAATVGFSCWYLWQVRRERSE